MQLVQGGCGIVERKCVCEFRPSLLCTDDPTRWYYRDFKECQYNLQAIIQQELEAENQETISDASTITESIVCKPNDPTCIDEMQGDDPCAGGQCPSNESTQCPPDSYQVSDGGNSTRCACKPCSSDISHCKAPLKLKLLKSAQNGEPGSCCDQYECALREVCGSGSGENDQEGAVWMKDACTRCTCRNGYSYCEQITDCHSQELELSHEEEEVDGGEGPSGCFALGSLKPNGDRWHEGPCTECTCVRGRKKCTTPICKSDCERPTITVPGECCPVCPPSCPEYPTCDAGYDLVCTQPDLFGCNQCTCRYNRVLEPLRPISGIDIHEPKKDILIEKPDITTLAITIVVVTSLICCCVGVYYYCHARRSRGHRRVNNSHAVFDEKFNLFDAKIRSADGQQIYRQLGTNHVDNV